MTKLPSQRPSGLLKKRPSFLAASAATLCALWLLPAGASGVTPSDYWLGTIDANWNTVSNWSSGIPLSSSQVNFLPTVPGTGATITLGPGEVADSLIFANSYTLTGGDLTLTTGTIDVPATFTATINSVLAGSGSVAIIDSGTVVLAGQNTFTGGTTVYNGILQVGDGVDTAALVGSTGSASPTTGGQGGDAVTVNSASTLNVSNNATITGGAGGVGTTTGGAGGIGVTFNSTGGFTQSGTITGGAGGSGGTTGGAGGIGMLILVNGTFTNDGSISGGAGGATGGAGGAGVYLVAGGTLVNDGTVSGGAGGSGSGSGGTGVIIQTAGTLVNDGMVSGGAGGSGSTGGAGGTAVSFTGGGTLTNAGTISGGSGGIGGVTGQQGLGVLFSGAGTLTNLNGGTINGGVVMGNFANSVTLEIGSTINGLFEIGGSSSTLTLTDDGTGGTQNYSAAVTGTTTFSGALTKSGTGTWIIDTNLNYGGGTTITAGTLQLGNGSFSIASIGTGAVTINSGATLALDLTSGATFSNAVTDNGHVVANLTPGIDYTISSIIGGTGDFTMAGTNTVTITGANTYNGGTTINSGTLQVGDGVTAGATLGTGAVAINSGAALTLDLANGETFANAVTDNGHVIADDFVGSNYTISSIISGSGDFTKSGANTVTVTGANTYTGGTEISGGTLQLGDGVTLGATLGRGGVTIDSGATLTFNLASGETFANAITDNGHIVADSPILSSFTISSVISGSGDFTKIDSNTVTVTGANTYTGGTTITGGTLQVGDGVTPGATLGTGAVTINGGTTLALDLTNGDSFANAVTDNGHIVTTGAGTYIMSGMITGGGDFTQSGTNTVIVSGANSYSNGTVINSGTLMTQNTSALGTGLVTVNGGKLATGSALTVSALNWAGGQIQVAPASGAILNVTGAFNNTGSGGGFVFDTSNMALATYTVTTFGSTTFLLSTDFTEQALNPNVQLQGTFALNGSNVQFTPTSATATGPVLDNNAPAGIPTFADFIVSGPVTTGGPGDQTTINSLTFSPGSTLMLSSSLFVTNGPVNLVGSSNLNLEGGSLTVNQLNILPGGLLDGSGTIFGNVVNGGVLSPGHSPGIIRMSGNYAQTSSGLLQIQIGGKDISQHDLLAVNGSATLGGTLQLLSLSSFKWQRNDLITFLTANGGVTGRFSMVENEIPRTTILEPTVVYSGNSVAVEAQQGSFKEFAASENLTPNQQAVGGMLDSAVNDRRANALIDYLDARILSKLPDDLAKISPDALTSVFTIGTALATVQSQNLQRRTDDIRSGSSGFNAANLAINGDGPSFSGGFDITTGVAGSNGPMDEGKEVKEMKQVAPAENRWGAFLSGTGDWVSVGDTNNARGYELESGGFTLGVDYKVCPNFAIGLMAGYTGTTSDLPSNGRIYVNGGKVGVYATTFVGGWYADVAAFGGYDSYDTRRPGLLGDARGSTEGGNVDALFGTGYDFKAGGFTFGPTASFNYTYVGTSAFNEYGSLAPLDIHGGSGESLRSAFGIKASYDWKVGGIVIKPEVRAAWQHEYGDAASDLNASLASGAGSTFTVAGPQLGRDSALVGAGFAIQCSERVSTYFYYDGELGRKNYESNAVTGGIRVAF